MRETIYRDDAVDTIFSMCCRWNTDNPNDLKNALMTAFQDLPSAQPEQHGRVFKGIVVEYLSYNTYPEYNGKPYFSIKYTENGEEFIGYGTYKPEVLSEYLKEYFMPSADPERCEDCGNFNKTMLLIPQPKQKRGEWTTEEVAEILARVLGDECACNFNGIDEWLPSACKYADTECPTPKEKHGCWIQFLMQGRAEM